MKKRKSRRTMDLETSIPFSEGSLAGLKKLIDSCALGEEVPFDLLAKHCPELLSEWYPGYPGEVREGSPSDPTPLRCQITNGQMTLLTPETELSTLPVDNDIPDGTYYVWLSKVKDKGMFVHGFYDHLDESVQSAVDQFYAEYSELNSM